MIPELLEMSEVLVVALTLWGECSAEPWPGKVMVGEVIVNRSHASGKSLKDVCLQYHHFSCWNGEKRQQKLINRTADGTLIRSADWTDCMEIARTICQTNYRTTTRADHYANLSLCSPKWAKVMKKVAVVGNHTFFYQNIK